MEKVSICVHCSLVDSAIFLLTQPLFPSFCVSWISSKTLSPKSPQSLIIWERELSVKSPCLHPVFVFGPSFNPPIPPFQQNPQSKEILLKLSMKYICSSSGGAQEKGKTGWHSVYHQNWWFSEFHPPLNASVLFCRFFKNLTPCMTKLRVQVLCLPYFTTDNS
jgi:hypothetical protein